MDSLTVKLVVGLNRSRAAGITANPNVSTPLSMPSGFAVTLSSTSTGASQANAAYGIGKTRTLNAGANEELDLYSFTSVLGDALTMTECRIFYMLHLSSSSASSITAGNGSGNNFDPLSIGTTTTITLAPGEGFLFISPTTGGMTLSNTVKTWKVLNNDGTNAASYEIGTVGSSS